MNVKNRSTRSSQTSAMAGTTADSVGCSTMGACRDCATPRAAPNPWLGTATQKQRTKPAVRIMQSCYPMMRRPGTARTWLSSIQAARRLVVFSGVDAATSCISRRPHTRQVAPAKQLRSLPDLATSNLSRVGQRTKFGNFGTSATKKLVDGPLPTEKRLRVPDKVSAQRRKRVAEQSNWWIQLRFRQGQC